MARKPAKQSQQLTDQLDDNLAKLTPDFQNNTDYATRLLRLGTDSPRRAVLLYFGSLIDSDLLHQEVLKPLMQMNRVESPSAQAKLDWVIYIEQSVIPLEKVSVCSEVSEIKKQILSGYVALLIEGETQCLLISIPRNLSRSIEPSPAEFVFRGPRDAFVEDIQINMGLVRKRLKMADLEMTSFVLGAKTSTKCILMYIKGIAKNELVQEVTNRIASVKTDSIFESGQLEELLEERPLSPFNQLENTERPDKVAAELLEGRVAILVDGSPTALLAPVTFFQLFSYSSDYYLRFMVGSVLRLLRFLAFNISIYLSALYISLVNYHPHLIPLQLVEILLAKREQVPFSPIVEIVIIQVIVDMSVEAILRVPSKLAQIIGVSGAIIIGQAAISANLISPAVIILVAITSIAGYTQTTLSNSFSLLLLRYVNLFLSAFLGLVGVMITFLFLIIHLCSLAPFGKAYATPMSPLIWSDFRDSILRLPKWAMTRQPKNPGTVNPKKQTEGEANNE